MGLTSRAVSSPAAACPRCRRHRCAAVRRRGAASPLARRYGGSNASGTTRVSPGNRVNADRVARYQPNRVRRHARQRTRARQQRTTARQPRRRTRGGAAARRDTGAVIDAD